MSTCIQLENTNKSDLPDEFRNDDVRYSENLVAYCLNAYTQENDIVFDPFAGYGTTLLVAEAMGRIPIGIEYDKRRVRFIQSQLKRPAQIIPGDARQLSTLALPRFDFSITSPPYMCKEDMENPFTAYREKGTGYTSYLADIRHIYEQVKSIMRASAKVVIEVANIKNAGQVTTLAWDIANEVSRVLHFEGEIVVSWDKYGYGYDHSYCLVYSKPLG
jgi:DNA modification methylase